jgi:hypothetical protein
MKTMVDDNIHKVWHSFSRKFMNPDLGVNFTLEGYDLMVAVKKWAKKYPKDVEIVGCDDNSFMCSYIVLIQHKDGQHFMGTTMVTISQNGDTPAVMFLYPSHAGDLIDALKKGKKWDEKAFLRGED